MPSLTVEGLILKRANFGEAEFEIEIMLYNQLMTKLIKIIQPPIDYALVGPYVEQWVALTRDHKKVIATDKNGGKLMKKLDKMSIAKNQAVLQYVLDPNKTYSPTAFS